MGVNVWSMMAKKYNVRNPILRFNKKYVVDEKSGCWVWLGYCDPSGYGKFSLNSKTGYAHRASYELHVGPIDDGLVIDHLCHNASCVNPEHLQPVTFAENVSGWRRVSGLGSCEHGSSVTRCIDGCKEAYLANYAREYRKNNLDEVRAAQRKRYWDNVEKERKRARERYRRQKNEL